jgi:hypothetical protein
MFLTLEGLLIGAAVVAALLVVGLMMSAARPRPGPFSQNPHNNFRARRIDEVCSR